MAAYAEGGVTLSLSGHYHPGQPALSANGTTYVTCPALCESPCRFLVVRVRDGAFEVDRHALKMPAALRLDDPDGRYWVPRWVGARRLLR